MLAMSVLARVLVRPCIQCALWKAFIRHTVGIRYKVTMNYARVAAVTGANKGIGYSIVRKLVLRYQQSASNKGPILIYLTSRNWERGTASLQGIYEDAELLEAQALSRDGGLADVEYRQLDISVPESRTAFKDFLLKRHPEGIDILVNNAGIAIDGFSEFLEELPPVSFPAEALIASEHVRDTLHANYYSTLDLTLELLPLVKDCGRIVNIASLVGKLNKYSPDITAAFKSATTVPMVTELMERFQIAVDQGRHTVEGWPESAYAVSKSGLIAATRAIGSDLDRYGGKGGVLINSCCPGLVSTDMTKGRGRRTANEGALTPVSLAIDDLGGRNGDFWERQQVSSW